MKVNRAIIVPFNNWWRQTNHCEPSVEAIDAFEAGFKAGAEYAKAAIEGSASALANQQASVRRDGND